MHLSVVSVFFSVYRFLLFLSAGPTLTAAFPGGGTARRGAALRHAGGEAPQVRPTPATVAISTFLKAGESVFQPLLWTNTVFHALRGAQPLFHALFGVKTLSGHRLS